MRQALSYLRAAAAAAAVTVLSFTAISTAFAATDVQLPEDGAALIELARPVFQAIVSGNYALSAALALVLAVAVARRYGPAWFRTDLGGAALTVVASFGGALATALAASTAPTWAMAYAALKIALVGAGGYVMLAKLLDALAKSPRTPKFLRPVLAAVSYLLGREPNGAAARAKAEKAGQDAVKANPGRGFGPTDELA